MIYLKTKEDINILKKSGRILSLILKKLSENAKEGVALKHLNNLALKIAKKYNAEMTFHGYKPDGAEKPFPAAICTSVNDVVVHGIPNDYILKNGDVLKIDAGITYDGLITDAARTIIIGDGTKIAIKIKESTKKALNEAIKQVKPGKTTGDIGYIISKRAKKDGFFVLKELTGHGVGYELHEDPVIFNFGERGKGIKLKPGMTLAIEPMFSETSEYIIQNKDESYSSVGRGLTAHFEDSIAITEEGNIILTR